jgi:hypothetical protein
MSLSPAEREELQRIASTPLPEGSGVPAVHLLAALYRRYGGHSAREVTDVIGDATLGGAFGSGHFGGFIEGSDSTGFMGEVRDPDISNAQTGHFYSFTIWALNGISEFEAAAALGHEFVSDTIPFHEALQIPTGVSQAAAFRDFLTAQPLDPNGTLDYAALDAVFSANGWSDRINPDGRSWETSYPLVAWETDERVHSGNSLEDLRATVAGFHLGRLIRSGCFRDAEAVAAWLERNILEGHQCRVSFDGETPVLASAPAR